MLTRCHIGRDTCECGGGQGYCYTHNVGVTCSGVGGWGGGGRRGAHSAIQSLGDNIMFNQINKATMILFDAVISHSNSSASHDEVIRYTHGLLAMSNSTQ